MHPEARERQGAIDVTPAVGAAGHVASAPEGAVRSAAVLIGAKVVDVEGVFAGEVTDLMVDPFGGRIVYALVAVGVTLGFGGERYAVPWNALEHDAAAGAFRLRCTQAHLADAPIVEREFWPAMADDERWALAVHRHFEATPRR